MNDAVSVSLAQLDAQLQRIAQLVTQGADGDLARACDALQQQVSDFQALWQKSGLSRPVPAALAFYLRKTAATLASTQENLARHAVLTQQALQTLFPQTQSATYNVAVGARARNPYSSVGRQSGEFQVVAA